MFYVHEKFVNLVKSVTWQSDHKSLVGNKEKEK